MSANNCQPTYVFHISNYGAQPVGGMWTIATNPATPGQSTMTAPTGSNATRRTSAPKNQGAQRGNAPNQSYAWVFAPVSKTTAAPVQTGQPAANKNTRWAAVVPASTEPAAKEFGRINVAGFCSWRISVPDYEADSGHILCHSGMQNMLRVQPQSQPEPKWCPPEDKGMEGMRLFIHMGFGEPDPSRRWLGSSAKPIGAYSTVVLGSSLGPVGTCPWPSCPPILGVILRAHRFSTPQTHQRPITNDLQKFTRAVKFYYSLGNGMVPPPPPLDAAAPDRNAWMFGTPALDAAPAGTPRRAPAAAEPLPKSLAITGGGNTPLVRVPVPLIQQNNARPAPPPGPAIGASVAGPDWFVAPAPIAAPLNPVGFLVKPVLIRIMEFR
ncbi:hypothetical protein HOY80DRAFT_1090756 [Tuber brumale]|nr:hypothetical protein HOY80DRAFT_1090756 [Tuber brumale]